MCYFRQSFSVRLTQFIFSFIIWSDFILKKMIIIISQLTKVNNTLTMQNILSYEVNAVSEGYSNAIIFFNQLCHYIMIQFCFIT